MHPHNFRVEHGAKPSQTPVDRDSTYHGKGRRESKGMDVTKGPIEGLLIIQPRVFEDPRGFFFESFNEVVFKKAGIDIHWAQDNHGMSVKDTVRGLHFQRGKGQAKLLRCSRGCIWDVVVDIRPDSPTLGQWHAMEISAENRAMLLIREGFAHGYAVMSDEADVLYKCSTVYDPETEDEIQWNDPDIGIEWPVKDPVLSKRDLNAKSFAEYLESVRNPVR